MGITAEKRIIRAQIRQKRREVVPRLKAAIKRAKAERKKSVKKCASECRAEQAAARKRAITARKKLDTYIKRLKGRARDVCNSCKTVDTTALDRIKTQVDQLASEMREIEKLRKQAASLKSTRGRAGGLKAAEKRSESDSEVLHNLAGRPALIEHFKKIRQKIKPSRLRSRTEAYLEYVHNHPAELEEFRSKKEQEYEKHAAKLFRERAPECSDELSACRRELEELKAAEKFLQEVDEDIPF